MPPAAQSPAAAHDTDNTPAWPPLLRAAVPGTSIGSPQTPVVSPTTNAWLLRQPSLCAPPAAPSPAAPHATEITPGRPPLLRAAVPGTSTALPQTPFVSLTTTA